LYLPDLLESLFHSNAFFNFTRKSRAIKRATMKLTAEQQKGLLAKYGVCANDAYDKSDKVLCEFRESRLNLAICPSELVALDPNAEMLWSKLLRTVGVTVSKGEHIEERRAWILRNFGLPALLQRLRPGMSERQRARIWWREAAACSEGESIPDLTPENLHALNPWMVSAEHKYQRPSAGDGKRGRPDNSREEILANKAARQRGYRAAKRGVLFLRAPAAV
jgi:hypothetical protein